MSEIAAFFEVEKRIYQGEHRGISTRLATHYARVRHELSQDISASMVVGFSPPQTQKPIVLVSWPSYSASPDAPTIPDNNKTIPLPRLHVQGGFNDVS